MPSGSEPDTAGSPNVRPWTVLYDSAVPAGSPAADETALSSFRDAVRSAPDAPCYHAEHDTRTFAQVDRDAEAVAAALRRAGVAPGDRVVLELRCTPSLVIGLIAAWKAAATAVLVDPVAPETGQPFAARVVLVDDDAAALAAAASLPTLGAVRIDDALARWDGVSVVTIDPAATDIACISYPGDGHALGTTHSNLASASELYRRWLGIAPGDVLLCAAPLFDGPGTVASIVLGHRAAVPTVLAGEFAAGRVLRLAERWRCTVALLSDNVVSALVEDPTFCTRDLSAFTTVYCVGAVAPDVVDAWADATGSPLRAAYGSAESTVPSHAWPRTSPGPLDRASERYSIGIPLPGMDARIVDPRSGRAMPPGMPGELVLRGPIVSPGYLSHPDPTGARFADGLLRTGQPAWMDRRGWFYVVSGAVTASVTGRWSST